MKKGTIASLAAVIWIAGATILTTDSSRFKNAFNIFESPNKVEYEQIVSRKELKTALSKAANNLNYNIKFKEVYEKDYKLGSVQEIRNYKWTNVKVPTGFLGKLELTISDLWSNENVILLIDPSGFVSDKEIKQYLSTLSKYLLEQEK